MMIDKDLYFLMAKIISYPDEKFHLYLDKLSGEKNSEYPYFREQINYFKQHVSLLNQYELEEYYINTFLIEHVSSLDIGFILFGMDAKRNEFLLNIQGEQLKVKNDTGIELADHLPNILTLLTKMTDINLRDELAYSILIPAVREISKKFEKTDNFYRFIIKIILLVLSRDFKELEYEQIEINKNIKF